MKYISKGMTMEALEDSLHAKPSSTYTFTHQGQEFVMLNYKILLGQKTESSSDQYGSQLLGEHSASYVSSTRTIDNKYMITYYDYVSIYYLFEQDNMLYWGYINDLMKAEDQRIAEISTSFYNLIYKDYPKLVPNTK